MERSGVQLEGRRTVGRESAEANFVHVEVNEPHSEEIVVDEELQDVRDVGSKRLDHVIGKSFFLETFGKTEDSFRSTIKRSVHSQFDVAGVAEGDLREVLVGICVPVDGP